MKPVLLIIGEITPRMAERFSTAFTCHYIDKIADTEQFLAANGPVSYTHLTLPTT